MAAITLTVVTTAVEFPSTKKAAATTVIATTTAFGFSRITETTLPKYEPKAETFA